MLQNSEITSENTIPSKNTIISKTLKKPIPPSLPKPISPTESPKPAKSSTAASQYCSYFKNIFLLINTSIVLLFLQLSKSFLITKYFDQIGSLTFEIDEINITLILSLIYSIVFSDNLSILKGIPILQMFYLTFIVKKYEIDNVGIICLGLALFLTGFLFLKVYKLYVVVPYFVVVGVSVCLSFLFCFEMVFYSKISNKTASVFVFYDLLYFVKQNSEEFTGFYIFFFFLFVFSLLTIRSYCKFLPFVMIMVVLSILTGYSMSLLNPITTINFMKLPNILDFLFPISKTLQISSKYQNIELLLNPNFLKDIFLYTLLITFEFLTTVKLLQRNKSEKSNINREIKFLIFINLIHSFFGLLPITIGLDSNLAIKSVNGHYKYYYFVGLIIILIYPIYLYPIFSFMPLYLFSVIVACLFVFNLEFRDFRFLGFFSLKGIVLVGVMVLFNFHVELLVAAGFGVFLFFGFYLQNEKPFKGFFVERDFQGSGFKGFGAKIEGKFAQDFENHFEGIEEEKVFFKSDDVLKNSNRNQGLKILLEKSTYYVFDGIFNFFYCNFHVNNICDEKKEIVILDFSKIKEYDANFLDEYYQIVQALIKKGKVVYLTGFERICFKRKIFIQNWIYDLYEDDKILFLQE